MSSDPRTIHTDQLADLLRGLGLDPVDMRALKRIHMEAGLVTVERYLFDDHGKPFLAHSGGKFATETTSIKVTSS